MSYHLAFNRQAYDMSILNVKKFKTDGDSFELSFYREQPAPIPNQAQAPHPMAPRQTLDMFRGEIQAMMEDMSAVLFLGGKGADDL